MEYHFKGTEHNWNSLIVSYDGKPNRFTYSVEAIIGYYNGKKTAFLEVCI